MIYFPTVIDVPLRADEEGVIRVGSTRVTLQSVIADFHRGATPEEIVHDYPVLNVADVYYIVGYYLANQAEVDSYIQHQREDVERIRRAWEAEHPPSVTKAAMLSRLEEKSKQSGKS